MDGEVVEDWRVLENKRLDKLSTVFEGVSEDVARTLIVAGMSFAMDIFKRSRKRRKKQFIVDGYPDDDVNEFIFEQFCSLHDKRHNINRGDK